MVVPVRDEEALLARCLDALRSALGSPTLAKRNLVVTVVLDACIDDSFAVVRRWEQAMGSACPEVMLRIVEGSWHNVGVARHVGAMTSLRSLWPLPPSAVWLATTDADSAVTSRWLAHQVALHDDGVLAWAGSVTVTDWVGRAGGTGDAWLGGYLRGGSSHRHVHGANFGVDGAAYLQAGGFPPLASDEDHGLYRALLGIGVNPVHDWEVPVVTSSRPVGRAPRGFASFLSGLEARAKLD